MSDIYNDLFQELEPKRYVAGSNPDPLRLEAGQLLESALKQRLQAVLMGDLAPGELVEPEHGIIFSPDLILYNAKVRVGEVKLSWLSMREMPIEETNGLPPKFDKYIAQMESYCHCLETPYARLYMFGVNGDYKRPYQPKLQAWDIEFSARELHENWEAMINHARRQKFL